MAITTWMALEDLLAPAVLTVRAQALPPLDTDQLLWDTFCPREDVDSVRLYDVYTVDYRPAADRREWNARGRLVPQPPPARRLVTIVPIESRDTLDELELQRVMEAAAGTNADVIRRMLGVSLTDRADKLVRSNYRRVEKDFVQAWTTGTITQRNPENASQTVTASFGFDTARINTALTAWNDGGVNAYDLLLAWIAAAEDKVGPIKGAMLNLTTLNAILADAPNLQNSVKMTRTQLADRISEDVGKPFTFYVNETGYDSFTDGGISYTRVKYWPVHVIAAVPADGVVGRTAFAPVVRAMDVSNQVPDAGVDVRGCTVYHEAANGGRELMIECQLNALPIPQEQKVYVTDTGV